MEMETIEQQRRLRRDIIKCLVVALVGIVLLVSHAIAYAVGIVLLGLRFIFVCSFATVLGLGTAFLLMLARRDMVEDSKTGER